MISIAFASELPEEIVVVVDEDAVVEVPKPTPYLEPDPIRLIFPLAELIVTVPAPLVCTP